MLRRIWHPWIITLLAKKLDGRVQHITRQARRGKAPAVEALEGRMLMSTVPVVTTAAATSVSATEATLNGSVNPAGSTATVRFQYSTDPTFTPTVKTVVGFGFNGPTGVAVDAAGDVFVADANNNAVKEVLPNGTIKTIGSAFNGPTRVALDTAGDVFVGDSGNNAVKEVLPNGTINTIGSGFIHPDGVAVDNAGDVFVADTDNNEVKEVLPNGTIKTIGSGFDVPLGVAVDTAGDVFVADIGSSSVKEVLPNGMVTTIGSGFLAPEDVSVDSAGNVFVADTPHGEVKEVLPNGTIKTIASGFTSPQGVAVDASGNVFVADEGHSEVVELSPQTIAAVPSPLTGSTAQAVSAAASGLAPATTYYFRAVAASAGGTVAGSTDVFTTPPPAIAFLAGVPGDGTPQTFVQNLYRELLSREPDSGGQASWVSYLAAHNNSTGRDQVIQAFLNSSEYAIHYITTLYTELLGRAPDAAGLQFWTQKMGAPGTAGRHSGSADEKYIVAAFLGSEEFYIDAGNAPQSWINAVYEGVFGRAADGQGMAFWTNELAIRGPNDRDGIVRELLSTPEAAHLVLDSLYPAVGGTSSNPMSVPGAPVGTGSTDLATITGDGWETLYLEGPYDSQPQGNDTFFNSLAGGVGWDDIQLLLLETSQFYGNPNRPITS